MPAMHITSNIITKAFTDLFGRLSHSLIRANARAIPSRSYSHLVQQVDELFCVWLYTWVALYTEPSQQYEKLFINMTLIGEQILDAFPVSAA